jgi:hypothetical protein
MTTKVNTIDSEENSDIISASSLEQEQKINQKKKVFGISKYAINVQL